VAVSPTEDDAGRKVDTGGKVEEKQLVVTLEQKSGYEFLVKFDEGVELLMDEPAPLGEDKGPGAAKVLSAAIGNCLSASLLFCLQKSRIEARGIKTTVTTKIVRNEQKRLRIGSSHARIIIDVDRSAPERFGTCLKLFEEFCTVTSSVRSGIPVQVEIVDNNGERIYSSQ